MRTKHAIANDFVIKGGTDPFTNEWFMRLEAYRQNLDRVWMSLPNSERRQAAILMHESREVTSLLNREIIRMELNKTISQEAQSCN
jgi:hypothetical protein